MQLTFAMIKPDAVERRVCGKIIDLIEQHGFEILQINKSVLPKALVEAFYDIHRERPFFKEMVDNITAGPVITLILKKENAVADWRTLMGATNPAAAEPGTVRALYGVDISKNAAHGSDSIENGIREIGLMFPSYINSLLKTI